MFTRDKLDVSSSLRDVIVLVLNIEVFQIKFFLKIKSLKKKKKKVGRKWFKCAIE